MDEKELWEKFAADGKVDNYLEYRKHLEMQGKMELKLCDENKCGGLSDKRTEYRGIRPPYNRSYRPSRIDTRIFKGRKKGEKQKAFRHGASYIFRLYFYKNKGYIRSGRRRRKRGFF